MSFETTSETENRSLVDRVRTSPFLSELLANRLALVGIVLIIVMILIAIYARTFLDPAELAKTQLGINPTYHQPSIQYLFGTDRQGRNILPRVLYGAWLALLYGTITVGISTLLGVSLGVIAAYYGGSIDDSIMRIMDVLLAFPSLLLALAIVSIFPENLGLWRAVVALTLVYTPRFARVIRGAALAILEEEFIDASIALGATDPRVLVFHILPNTLAPITVQSTLNFGLAIIDLASLSFLGFGATAGTPTWGLMLSNGVKFGLLTGIWWWSFFPGLFLAITVLGFNLLGDGMRDALDPRMRKVLD